MHRTKPIWYSFILNRKKISMIFAKRDQELIFVFFRARSKKIWNLGLANTYKIKCTCGGSCAFQEMRTYTYAHTLEHAYIDVFVANETSFWMPLAPATPHLIFVLFSIYTDFFYLRLWSPIYMYIYGYITIFAQIREIFSNSYIIRLSYEMFEFYICRCGYMYNYTV